MTRHRRVDSSRSASVASIVLGGAIFSGCLSIVPLGVDAPFLVPVSRVGDGFDLELPLTDPGRRVAIRIESVADRVRSDGSTGKALLVSYPDFLPVAGFGAKWELAFDLGDRQPIGANHTPAGAPPGGRWFVSFPVPGTAQLFAYLPFVVFLLEGRVFTQEEPVPLTAFGLPAEVVFTGIRARGAEEVASFRITIRCDVAAPDRPTETRRLEFESFYSPAGGAWIEIRAAEAGEDTDPHVRWHRTARGEKSVPWKLGQDRGPAPSDAACRPGPADGRASISLPLGQALQILGGSASYATWRGQRTVAIELATYDAFVGAAGERASWRLRIGIPGTADAYEATVTRETGPLGVALRDSIEREDRIRLDRALPPASWYPDRCLEVATLLGQVRKFLPGPPSHLEYSFESGLLEDEVAPGARKVGITRPDAMQWEFVEALPSEAGGGQLRVILSGRTGEALLFSHEGG